MSFNPAHSCFVGGRLLLVCSLALVLGLLPDSAMGQNGESEPFERVNEGPWEGFPQGRKIADFQKFFFLSAAEWNGNPIGFWSNGESLWVGDWLFSAIFAYDLESTDRQPERDFKNFAQTGNRSARGLWSDGQTMWVTDEFVDKVFAYDLETIERLPDLDMVHLIAAGNESPTGIWSNGETIWIADDGDDKIYAYDFETRQPVPSLDFDTLAAAGNTGIRDIWSDGKTMWVTEIGSWTAWGGWTDGRLFAYDLASHHRVPAKDVDYQTLREAGIQSPNAVWSDGKRLWVGDRPQHRVYVFDLDESMLGSESMTERDRNASFDLTRLGAGGNAHPSHLWSNGEILWVADNDDEMIYAYDLESHSRRTESDLSLVEILGDRPYLPAGMWSDGVHCWLVDWYTTQVFVFDLANGTRQPERELGPLAAHGNEDPAGMWSDGNILWILDTTDSRVYAYDLITGERQPDEELNELSVSGNSFPRGLWSDGETFWIGDWENDRIDAFRRGKGNRAPEYDLDRLVEAGNLSPVGLWSDGQRLWISDYADAQIYSYALPGVPVDVAMPPDQGEAEIRVVRLAGGAIQIEFTRTLKQADRVEGPYTEVEGAVSPLTVGSDQSGRFFIAE